MRALGKAGFDELGGGLTLAILDKLHRESLARPWGTGAGAGCATHRDRFRVSGR